MKRAVVFEITTRALLTFKVDATAHNLILQIFDHKVMIEYNDVYKYDNFYVHTDIKDNIAIQVTVLPFRKFEYQLVDKMSPQGLKSSGDISSSRIRVYEKKEKKEKEISKMINTIMDYKITTVDLKEVHGIALKVAIDNIIKSGILGDARIEKDDGKVYLVLGSSVQEITGTGFSGKAEKFLVGKTLTQLDKISKNENPKNARDQKNRNMVKLIEGLDIINKIELEACDIEVI